MNYIESTLTENDTKLQEISRGNFITDDGRVYILGPFDRSISSEVIPAFRHLIDLKTGEKDPEIEIYINSHGGYCDELFGLLSCISMAKACGIRIVTINMGVAYSCGSILAVCGDYRKMSKYADNVAHLGHAGFGFSTTKQLDRQNDYFKKYLSTIIDIYANHTKVPRKKLEEMLSDDHLHLDPKQCLKLGFCDEIF